MNNDAQTALPLDGIADSSAESCAKDAGLASQCWEVDGAARMKTTLLLAGALSISTPIRAADLGSTDLPRIHAEYKANQARWARDFLDKTFAATMTIGGVSNVFGNDSFMVTFMENPSDWMPGAACQDAPASDFLISKNKGDSIFFRGVVKDHSVGSLDLRDCEFFDSEKAA